MADGRELVPAATARTSERPGASTRAAGGAAALAAVLGNAAFAALAAGPPRIARAARRSGGSSPLPGPLSPPPSALVARSTLQPQRTRPRDGTAPEEDEGRSTALPVGSGTAADEAAAAQEAVGEFRGGGPDTLAASPEDEEITRLLREALARYRITIRTRRGEVTVRTPYWSRRDDYTATMEEARAAEPETARFLDRAGHLAYGTQPAERLQRITQRAVDAGLVQPATAHGIRAWMARFGLGVDCAGFLTRVMQDTMRGQSPGAAGEQAAVGFLQQWGGSVPRPAALVERMPRVRSPEELRPGDIQQFEAPAHARIVVTARPVEAGAADPPLPRPGTWMLVEMAESSGSLGGPLEREFAIPAGDFTGIHDRTPQGVWRRSRPNTASATNHRPQELHRSAAGEGGGQADAG